MKFPRFLRKAFATRLFVILTVVALAALWFVGRSEMPRASAQVPPLNSYKNFESPQVHPLALTPDGTRLVAVNSPEHRLSVFQLTAGVPTLTAEIPVGLEPVSVAVRNDREAWVVNWLSDSVSVVDLATGNVTRTFDVGDEPTDVVFAGQQNERAFVCVSGLNQIKVFDANAPASAPQVVNLRGKLPRSLARDASGAQVFVSVFESGNQTAIVSDRQVASGGGLPAPQPAMRAGLPAPPNTGLIVKWNGAGWMDERGDTRWTNFIPFRLADVDVVVINANAAVPSVANEVRGVGTHIGNAVYDAAAARLLVVNTESNNFTRFEPNLRGRFVQTRVSAVSPASGSSTPFDLNSHINHDAPDGSDTERAQSLAMPSDITRASDGTLYVAALGSAKVGVLDGAGGVVSRIGVGQGPTGLALDEARQRLYVLNRFEETVSVVDTNGRSEVARVPVGFNPEPAEVRAGRRFLYDASFSAHGDVSCASCHQNGHRDGLAWDLGNPQGQIDVINNPGAGSRVVLFPLLTTANFHPMKGPMTTQSLRGIFETGLLHWRGDRTTFSAFNPAFTNLLGSTRPLDAAEMQAFESFVRTLVYPPNPLQNLNRTMPTTSPSGANAARGQQLFNTARLDGNVATCAQCHSLPTGTNNFLIDGFLLQEPQAFKVPQLRGLYQKTGMSNTAGEQLTGFGFAHDGSFDNLLNFLRSQVFTFANDTDRRDVAQFVLSMDTGVPPIVGVQVTANADNKTSPAVAERINLLAAQALAQNCDLVVRGIYKGAHRSFLYVRLTDKFETDRAGETQLTRQALLDTVEAGGELTFTGVLSGRGRRLSIDRDGDNTLDGDAPLSSVNISGRVVDANGNGLAGVTVTLGGSQAATTQTDANGRYLFGYLSTTGTHVVTPLRDGVTFGPASRTFTNPAWHQTAYFVAPTNANAIDAAQFFVAQNYRDFLNREPDASGLAFWTGEITGCGANVGCIETKRINVSAAFFLSIEFQETGYLVYRLYQSSFARMPRYGELLPDTQSISNDVIVGQTGWEPILAANKQAFLNAWVSRPAFKARFDGMTNAQYVDTLFANAGINPSPAERDALVNGLNNATETRVSVIRKITENDEFKLRERNRAFVLIQYFGYLRRNPDDLPNTDFSGYNFWLGKLESFNGNHVAAEMVKAFITSGEYRARFGP
ncbi:MAG TPA: carboxypeptidase regulatory-like domain-containing protein [Pyrinomonadaceae bacterium]|jgi:YVTN family beta-propeller protein|nr:carboxypeptidase regulatory-like domain-containing protein [Pyrinomonadaceae bacterium]